MKAIVYTSNSGHTKEYSEILSKKLNVPCYNLKEAKKVLQKTDDVIYLGWMMAGQIKGLKKAKSSYNLIAICGVGMTQPEELQQKLDEANKNNDVKRFYLQGGIDINKLGGMYKFMIKAMVKGLTEELEAKMNKTQQEIETLEMIKNNKNCVCEDNLKPIVSWALKE